MDKNDPKLTAYVLGELDAAETKRLESVLATDPELRAEVEEIRKTALELETFMKAEPMPSHNPEVPLRSTSGSLMQVDQPQTKKKRWYSLSPLVLLLVIVSLVGVLSSLTLSVVKPARELARQAVGTPVFRDEMTLPKSVHMNNRVEYFNTDRHADKEAETLSEKSETKKEVFYAGEAIEPLSDLNAGKDVFAAKPQETAVSRSEPVPMAASAPTQSPAAPGRVVRGLGSLSETEPQRAGREAKRNFRVEANPEIPRGSKPNSFGRYDPSGGRYAEFKENEFLRPQNAPFSTFSIDVDTASYSVMRRYLMEQRQVPPPDAVRIEEFVNYFDYHDAPPVDGKPFATHVDLAKCPWNVSNLLARIAIKGKEIPKDDRPPLNLVFLVDVSGSMSGPTRLPLVQQSLTELTEMLTEQDRVAIVTYAGTDRVALPSVSGREKRAILESIAGLSSGGTTAGAAGIRTAYEVARKNFTKNGQNRVILCTDGDFNVGMSDDRSLQKLIETEAKSKVFLTVLGFGMGNHNDRMLEILADKGNGNYGYIDSIEEARKLLIEGLSGTLITIAKDVKIQVDFNPKKVAAYRLLGYENRKLRDEDFHNDKIDAGEIGAGHSVTALYEIVPVGATVPSAVDKSRYAEQEMVVPDSGGLTPPTYEAIPAHDGKTLNELMFVKLRYKEPDAEKSQLIEKPIADTVKEMSNDFEFAASVALFAMLLRDSRYSGDGNWETVLELAKAGAESDKYRLEFLELVQRAKELKR